MALQDLFQKPEELDDKSAQDWFQTLADTLLNGAQLWVGGEAHRLTEIEFYYFNEGLHPDYFTHRDPLQLEFCKWYFHRMNGTYKGGSFKGLDISFGDGENHGGVLLRGLQKPDGELIDGPCLLVDHLLSLGGYGSVAAMDEEIDSRPIWDQDSPMHLLETDQLEPREVYLSSRVGLTLKRSFPGSNMPQYIARPYRFLSEPRRIKKGKVNLAMTLHDLGYSVDEINKLTGSPKRSIQKNVDAFTEGEGLEDFSSYLRLDLKSADLARLHGTSSALNG